MALSETGTIPPLPQPTAREQALANELRDDREALLRASRYLNQREHERADAVAAALKLVVYRLEHPLRQGM